MKKLLRMLSVAMCLCMIVTIMPISNYKVAKAATGTWACGSTTVTLDNETLKISGNGPMADYGATPPWNSNLSVIKYITIEDGVTSIGANTIINANNLVTLNLGSGIKNVDYINLQSKSKLQVIQVSDDNDTYSSVDGILLSKDYKSVKFIPLGRNKYGITLSEEMTYIPSGLLNKCPGLTQLNIPSKIQGMATDAFLSVSPSKLTVSEDNQYYISVDNVLYTKDLKKLVYYPATTKRNYEVIGSVTEIGDNAFRGDGYLKVLTLPESLEKIGNNAISLCSALTTLDIPETVRYIGYQGLSSNGKLTELILPESMDYLGAYALASNTSLTNVVLPNNLTEIPDYLLNGNNKLETVNIPENITKIGDYSFYGCKLLKEITLPNTLLTIGTSAFRSCSGLLSVTIPNSVTTLGNWAFNSNSLLTKAIVPDSVTTFGSDVFNNAHSTFTFLCNTGSEAYKYALSKGYKIGPIPEAAPSINTQSKSYDKYTNQNVSFSVSFGEGNLKASGISSLSLNGTVLDTGLYSFNSYSVTINAAVFAGMTIGNTNSVEVTFNDAASTKLGGVTVKIIDTSPAVPPVIETQSAKYIGHDISYTIGYGSQATSIVSVLVNGADLPNNYYTVDSTTLTLKDDYLSVLNNGLYIVKLVYNEGTIIDSKLSFTVPKDTSNVTPATSVLNIIYVNGSTQDVIIPLSGNPVAVKELYMNSAFVDSQYYNLDPMTSRLTIKHELLNAVGTGTHSMILELDFGNELSLFSGSVSPKAFLAFGIGVNDVNLLAAPGETGIIVSSIEKGTTGLTYHPGPGGSTIIDGYTGDETDITIPDDVNGSPVTGIDDLGNKPIDTVTIPDTVTDIAPGAIGGDTDVIGSPGSAAEDYANNNGNVFTPNPDGGNNGGNPGNGEEPGNGNGDPDPGNNGGNGGSTGVAAQNITFDKTKDESPVITGVTVAEGTTIDYITINGYRIWANGVVELINQEPVSMNLIINDMPLNIPIGTVTYLSQTQTVATPSAIGYTGQPFVYDAATGKVQLDPNLLKLLGLSSNGDYNIGFKFSDGTEVNDAVNMHVTDPGNDGTDPGNGGTDPGNGGTDPGNGGTDPGNGGTDPGNGGTDPGNGGTDPGNGGTDPGNGGSPSNGGSNPSNGGIDSGNGGTNPGNGKTDSETISTPVKNVNLTQIMELGSKIKIKKKLPNDVISFTSSNKRVAVVDKNGIVKTKKKGTATITAKVTNAAGITYYKIKVLVQKNSKNDNTVKHNLVVYKGGSEKLLGDAKNTSFHVTNKAVATISKLAVVKGIKLGSTKIKVTESTDDIVLIHTVTVTVKAPYVSLTNAKSSFKLGEKYKFKAIAVDSTDNKILWKSSNPKIATIDNTGNLKAKLKGKATIIAKCGKLYKKILITVK